MMHGVVVEGGEGGPEEAFIDVVIVDEEDEQCPIEPILDEKRVVVGIIDDIVICKFIIFTNIANIYAPIPQRKFIPIIIIHYK